MKNELGFYLRALDLLKLANHNKFIIQQKAQLVQDN